MAEVTSQGTKEVTVEVSLFCEEIINNFDKMNTETGSPTQPVVIDPFVRTDISGIKYIMGGDTIRVSIDYETKQKLNAELIYLQVQNVTSKSKDIMDSVAWSKYFDFSKEPENELTTVAPNGCIYFEPIKNTDDIIVHTRKIDKNDKDDILITYYVVLSFRLKGEKYYCIIDPIGHISGSRKP